MLDPLIVSASIVLAAKDLSFAAARASGPGGQNVNKVASKVELRFDLEASEALDAWTKQRLRTLARGKLDAEGKVLVVSQRTRDQRQNLDDAREKLRLLVAEALERPRVRRATRPSYGSKQRRLSDKRHAADKKTNRRAPGD